MRKIIFAFALCFIGLLSKAQTSADTIQYDCGHVTALINQQNNDPNFNARILTIEQDVQNWITNHPNLTGTYTIPIVFHVLHDGDTYGQGSNVSLAQIKWQINALNNAFANNTGNYNFQNNGTRAVNTSIKFCLATIPQGTIAGTPVQFYTNPANNEVECGVMRYNVPTASLSHSMINLTTSQQTLLNITHPTNGVGVFPFENYLNIWLVNEICQASGCNVIGYSNFPGAIAFDGIVMRADAIGDNTITTNTFPMFNGLDNGKILAHEVGHYLYLYHTFHLQTNDPACPGSTNANCAIQGDLVCDTPPTSITGNPGTCNPAQTCIENITYNNPPTASTDLPDMAENYMSYSDDNCMNTFTHGQAQRMQAVLNLASARQNLVSIANLASVGLDNSAVCACSFNNAAFSYQYLTNPCSGVEFLAPLSSSLNAGTSYVWNFGDGNNGVGLNPVHTYTTTGTYTVTLTINYAGGVQATQNATINITTITAQLSSHAAGNICNGSAQQLTATFQGAVAPVTYVITNGLTTQTYTANTTLVNGDVVGQFYFSANINQATYTIINVSDSRHCPRNPNAQIALNIINCCANLVVNGDFEQGNIGFTTDNIISCTSPSPISNYGYASVRDAELSVPPNTLPTCVGFGAGPSIPTGSRNAIFSLDCRVGNNQANVANPLGQPNPIIDPLVSSILWQQTGINVTAGSNYNVDLFVAAPNGGNGPSMPFRVRLEIFDNASLTLLSSGNFDLTPSSNFFQYSFLWNNPTYNGAVTMRFSQVQFFNTSYFDPSIDDISIRRNNPPAGGGAAYAGPDLNICGAGALSGSGGNGTFTWTNAAGLSATNIAQPIASPTLTTTYTLTTINACGTTSDEVTVNVVPGPTAPTITASPNVICVSGSSTLSATPLAGAFVRWYNVPVGGTPLFVGNNFVTPIITVNTTYYADYQIGQCISARTAFTLTVSGNPVVIVNPTNPTTCAGAPINLTATGASVYNWSLSNTLNNSTGTIVTSTPYVTTTYTITGTSAAGCQTTITKTVTVPAVNLQVTPTISYVCSGTSAPLTASGALSYTWTPNTAIIPNNTSAAIAVSPTITTVYTVTALEANGCTTQRTTSVIVTPSITTTITPNNPTICAGQSVSITAGGATTYSWTPATGLSATTGATVSASPTTTTQYTVVGTTNGCVDDYKFTVTVNPTPTVTIAPSPAYSCTGAPANITASGATSYVWLPNTSLSPNNTSATVAASPTTTTVYTVTGTGNLGCTAQSTVIVNASASTCTAAASNIISAVTTYTTTSTNFGFPAGPIAINQPITIGNGTTTNTVTINCTDVRIAPSRIINVSTNATLIIDGSWLHGCVECSNGMWRGITVSPGGVLIVRNNSIIEDMLGGVINASGGTPVANIQISNTIFNKNATAVSISQYTVNASPATNNVVTNSIFTCRVLPSTSPTAANFNAIKQMLYATPNAITYPTTTTKAGARSVNGILLTTLTNATAYRIGISGVTNVSTGAGNVNVFDNLDYGIKATNSNVDIKNNVFQNCKGNNIKGIGVYATETVEARKIIIGSTTTTINNNDKNIFRNNLRGIDITGYLNSTIINNSFDNLITEPVYSNFTNTFVNTAGQHAIFIKPIAASATAHKIDVYYNNITNCVFGVHINRAVNYNRQVYHIQNNTVGYTGSNYFVTGIFLEDAAANTPAANSGSVILNGNTVVGANYFAILCNYVKRGLVISANNELSILTSPAGVSATAVRASIGLQYCQDALVEKNLDVKTTGSTFTTTTNPNLANEYLHGIYLTGTTGTQVSCNQVQNTSKAITFEGNCGASANVATTYINNTHLYSNYGLTLQNSGVIGQQGTASYCIQNAYGNSGAQDISLGQTYVVNTANANTASKLYVQNNACPITAATVSKPCDNLVFGAGSFPYSLVTGILTSTCLDNVADLCNPGGGGGGTQLIANSASTATAAVTSTSDVASRLQVQAADNTTVTTFGNELLWQKNKDVFTAIVQNPNLKTNNTALTQFHNSNFTSALGKLTRAKESMSSGNYAQAQTLNNSVSPSNIPEQNQKLVNSLLLARLQNAAYNYTEGDITTLYNIANQCHLSGGEAVMQARALYNNIKNQSELFNDACVASATAARKINEEIDNFNLEEETEVKVYPNPNTGKLTVEIKASSFENCYLQIYSTSGNLVFSSILTKSVSINDIDMLVNGIYYYLVVENEKIIKRDKLVIIK